MRGLSYLYSAWIPGRYSLLRYHNIHRNDDYYHHKAFNPQTQKLIISETLERYQFPVMHEVIDEIAVIMELYPLPAR